MERPSALDAPASPSVAHIQRLFELVSRFRVSQAIYVAARLGIADLLAEGPRTSDDLARETGTHPTNLYRLLRYLSGYGLFTEVAPRCFALAELGAGLRSDVSGSVRPMTLLLMNQPHWQAWGHLLHSVQTGDPAFDHVHGMSFFEYMERNPDAAEVFNAAMSSVSARSGPTLVDVYDFSGVKRIVDVGGGHGSLIAAILAAYPTMQGVLLDLPGVVDGAQATLEAAGVVDRCEVVAGDFFTAVPPGGDVYLLQMIIHDWDDARATTILTNCRRVMQEGSRLLVVEERITPKTPLGADLEMMVELGGLQRTDEEYAALFAAAGFALTDIVPLSNRSPLCIFEGRPI